MPHPDIWTFIVHSSLIVKLVLMILLLASITSWTLIFQRATLLKQRKDSAKRFEGQFFSKMEPQQLFEKLQHTENSLEGLGRIYFDGFKAFMTSQEKNDNNKKTQSQVSRAMRIAHTHEVEDLEKNLSILATIGSNAVYVGLLGTVWGVMSAFEGLGLTAQATIATVAPGIAEALVATAMGLIVAIPAVVAFNIFNTKIESIENRYHVFQDEFLTEISSDAINISKADA
jgi:biopolymer transport protein TolQ